MSGNIYDAKGCIGIFVSRYNPTTPNKLSWDYTAILTIRSLGYSIEKQRFSFLYMIFVDFLRYQVLYYASDLSVSSKNIILK